MGGTLQVTDTTPAGDLISQTAQIQGLHDLARALLIEGAAEVPALASAIDFVLEGLYAQRKISRNDDWRYQASDSPRRQQRPEPTLDPATPLPERGGRKKYLQLTRASIASAAVMRYKYTKFTGDELEGIDLDELLSKLSDLFLSSGFDDPYGAQGGEGHSMQDLYDAVMEALLNGGLLER